MYKLLIVDDEKMIRLGIKKGIDWKSLDVGEVFVAASGLEALEVLEKEQPQIMLTDICMPDMSGLLLIEKAREMYPVEEMRIMVLTGYDRFEYARQCLQMNVQDFLLKPVNQEELKNTVREQIKELETIRIKREQNEKNLRTEGSKRQTAMENFMRNLVHRRFEKNKEDAYLEELKGDRKRPMEIALLIPEVLMDNRKENERDFQRMTIKNLCMDLIDARRLGITFSDDDGKIVVAFYADNTERNVTERVEELSEILENECIVKLRVVLGSEAEGLDALSISYNDAVFLLERESEGFQEILKQKSDRNKELLIQDVYREFKQAMISNITDGNKVMYVYEKFMHASESYNLSKAQVQKWCFDIAAGIYFMCITENGANIDNRMEPLLKALIGIGREEALEVTATFIRKLVFPEENVQHEIIMNAKHYIDEHLESELSVVKLSEKFYLSPNYFSRLFKRVTDEGCNEYIVRKRIEKSKLLLEMTSIKAKEIAVMVGYNDTSYFSLAFKKHTGMSLRKYRESLQKNRGIMEELQ